ncbi:hypothetical protein niasHS_013844 [Heterodera schachtii]|uniref:Uncharacterized protein n=1 Tax=Heterodera schachtii TaxID=97005 RepID=A0ABD2IM02_HETSC
MFYFQFNVMLVSVVALLFDNTNSVWFGPLSEDDLRFLREQGVTIKNPTTSEEIANGFKLFGKIITDMVFWKPPSYEQFKQQEWAEIRNQDGKEQKVLLVNFDQRIHKLCQFSARHSDGEDEKVKKILDEKFNITNRKKGDKFDPRFCFGWQSGCSTTACFDRDSGEPIFVVNGCSGGGMTCYTDEFTGPCHDQNGFIRCDLCETFVPDLMKTPDMAKFFKALTKVNRFCNRHKLEMPEKLTRTDRRTTTTTIAPHFFPNFTQSTTTDAANFTPIGQLPTVASGAEIESLLSITGTVLVSLIVLSVRLGVQF